MRKNPNKYSVFSNFIIINNIYFNSRCITSIMHLLSMVSHRDPSADDLTPVLIYVIIKVRVDLFLLNLTICILNNFLQFFNHTGKSSIFTLNNRIC